MKSILQTIYGKTGEIVTSYVQHIMQVPLVIGKNQVKATRILWKVSDSHTSFGYDLKAARSHWCNLASHQETIPGIGAELVINDDNWQEYNF